MAGSKLDMHDRYGIMAEMNMIPLIDVALVLLIIFMVMTPFLVRAQLKMNVPDAETGVNVKEEERTLTVQVAKQGQATIDGQPIAPDALGEALLSRIPSPNSWTVIVEADKDCALDHVVKVMDTAKKAGIGKLGIAVRREKRLKR